MFSLPMLACGWLYQNADYCLFVYMLLWPSGLVNQSSDSGCADLLESFKMIRVHSVYLMQELLPTI